MLPKGYILFFKQCHNLFSVGLCLPQSFEFLRPPLVLPKQALWEGVLRRLGADDYLSAQQDPV